MSFSSIINSKTILFFKYVSIIVTILTHFYLNSLN